MFPPPPEFRDTDRWWTGMTDQANPNQSPRLWRLGLNGPPATYFRWADNQPDQPDSEQCVDIVQSYGDRINDESCAMTLAYICESKLI